MPKIDDHELEILGAYEKGLLKSIATKFGGRFFIVIF
jgi:hypothetical protein